MLRIRVGLFLIFTFLSYRLIAQDISNFVLNEKNTIIPGQYGIDQKAGKILGNSDNMTGTIAIALFFVESNGTIDPDVYTWTRESEDEVIQQISDACNWWTTKGLKYGKTVSFSVIPYRGNDIKCQQGYEPILRHWTEKGSWIDRVMSNFGYSSGTTTTRVNSFNSSLKATSGTNWALSVFVCYNPSSAANTFNDGYTITDVYGGPYIHMLFRNGDGSISNSDLVAHSMGHIFGAYDECCNCDKSATSKSIPNSNCEKNVDGSVNTQSVDCIMKSKLMTSGVCTYTASHIGWLSVPFTHLVTSNPSGLQIVTTKTGQSGTQSNITPTTFAWEPGINVNVNTSSPQIKSSINYIFTNWSDGGSVSHDIVTQSNAFTITANFIGPPNPPELSDPDNNSVGISINPFFKWKTSSSALTYRLQVALDNSFLIIVNDQSNIVDTISSATGLESATDYYWRVQSSNSAGTGQWSSSKKFTTNVAKPNLVVPVNGSLDIDINPVLSWTAVNFASTYQLQISTNSDFSSLLYDQSNIILTSVKINGLAKNSNYYWRVKTFSSKGISDWSDIWTFKTLNTTATININKTFINFNTIGFLCSEIDSVITITNNSSFDDLLITSIYFDESNTIFEITEKTPITISPNSSKVITVKFNPESVGVFSNNLHILNSSNNNSNVVIPVSGVVVGSIISPTSTSINLGDIGYQTEQRDTIIKISNIGQYHIKINSCNFETKDTCFELVTTIPQNGITLNPNGYYYLRIRIKPLRLEQISNTFVISNNSSNFPLIRISFVASIKLPSLKLPAYILNFDSTSISNPSKYSSVVFKNTGDKINIFKVIITGDTSSFHLYKSFYPVSLTKDQIDSLIVLFAPKSSGVKTAKLNIYTDDPLLPIYTINLSGTGVGKPILTFQFQKIIFGKVGIGVFKDTVIVITNKGNFNLDISEISFQGSDKNSFSFLYGNKPVTLEQNKKDSIKIRITGLLPVGEKVSQLRILSNDPDKGVANIELNASIISPALIKSVDKIVFDSLLVGNLRDSILVLKNDGNDSLFIENIYLDGPFSSEFSFISAPLPVKLKSGDEVTLKLQFHPSNNGICFSRLIIVSNDPLHPEDVVVLRGVGKSSDMPKISFSPSALNFGNLEMNMTTELPIIIKNRGNLKLIIDSFLISGTGKGAFNLVSSSNLREINPADSLIVMLAFSPKLIDTMRYYYANLMIYSNDPINSIFGVSLSGVRSEKFMVVSDSIMNFGNVRILDTLRKNISISNITSSIIKIDSFFFDTNIDQPFSIGTKKDNIYIDPKSRYDLSIAFHPKSKNYYFSNLNIKSNYLSGGISKINLIGYTISPDINMPARLNFGKIRLDSIKTFTVNIINKGDADLNIFQAKIFGKDSNDFFLKEKKYPFAISPLAKDSIHIAFIPKKPGLKTAKLKVFNDDELRNSEIELLGEGVQDNLEVEMQSPFTFLLSQNYPNPFNPSTRIDYFLPERAPVSLRIFDIFGREVSVLVSEIQTGGHYSVTWSPKEITSGFYFYKLQAGSFSDIKKLIYLR